MRKSELVERAGNIFRQKRELKFPSVRERLLAGVVKPNTEIFLTSFDHANPNYPDRIITGKVRAGAIAEAMKSEKVTGVTLVLDTLSPKSEADLEGGGWALGLGIVPGELTKVMKDREIFYHRNELILLDFDPILEHFAKSLGAPLTKAGIAKRERETYTRQMVGRLGSILALYNFTIGEGQRNKLTTSQVLANLQKNLEGYLGVDTSWTREVLQSSMSKNIADALEELARLGYPFWNMPQKVEEPLLRYLDETGKEAGTVHFDQNEFVFIGKAKEVVRREKPTDIFNELKEGKVIPAARLLLATIMVAPEIPHFGNTYELERSALDWLAIDGSGLRLNSDFADSIPLGKIVLVDDLGRSKALSSLPVDLLHFPKDQLKEVVLAVADSGESQAERVFGRIEV